ncbi:hypothetical protein [Paenibacillus senegalimassiliensis]|uniref:hypothetical protein n=1 Tax=Paenibacillus senegalimassiliensis TaxID=1737426 RepID=UPI00073EE442|nr:hypothetical protein [Paenibacillus senegalimassiliensis]
MNKQTGQHHKEELGYLFNIEILVKNNSNALALQTLLELLNSSDKIIDYRINSGSELGKVIESMLANSKQAHITASHKHPEKTEVTKELPAKSSKPPIPETAISGSFKDIAASDEFQTWIQNYIKGNQLVRLYINRNGKRVNMPCRILNFQPETYTLSVYHVDEKQVYTLKLSEVIDLLDT